MNKYVYLFELRKELAFMSHEDREAAVRYYEEHFADAGIENEKEAIEHLGPPASLAAEIRREYEDGKAQPSGRDLTPLDGETYAGDEDGAGVKNVWQGQHWTGPNPPWREKGTAGDSTDSAGDGGFGQDGDYGAKGTNDARWDARAEQWGKKAADFGQKAGETAGRWGKWAEKKAGDLGQKAGSWWNNSRRGYEAKQKEYEAWQTENKNQSYERQYDDGHGRDEAQGSKYSYNYNYEGVYPPKKKRNIWKIIAIALLAIPVGIPAAAVLFSALVTVASLIAGAFVALMASGIGFIIGGIFCVAKSILTMSMFYNFAGFILMLGTGLFLLGLGIPLTRFSFWFAPKAFRSVKSAASSFWSRMFPKRGGHK